MSHIVEIQTQVRDPSALRAACDRVGLETPLEGEAKLFSGTATGWIVRLRDWRYPAVFDTTSGNVAYDNFGGRWGEQSRLDNLLQMYAVEKAKIEARRQGHSVTEQPLSDGSIRLTVSAGGAA